MAHRGVLGRARGLLLRVLLLSADSELGQLGLGFMLVLVESQSVL